MIHAELAKRSVYVGRKRLARLMEAAAWSASDPFDRDFTADGPNQLRVADITYIPTWADFLYLAIVLDVWNRRVVGWAMASHLRTELVFEALNMAIQKCRTDGVIHHSD